MFAPYMYFLITKFFRYYDNTPRPPHNGTINGHHHHQLCDKGATRNAKKKSPRDDDDDVSWATDKFSFIFLFIFFLWYFYTRESYLN